MAVKRSKGSALLITLIVMGISSVIVLSISRVALFQTAKIGSSEDSIGAYYAAEAGIAQGLKGYMSQTSNYESPSANLPNGAKYSWKIAQTVNQISNNLPKDNPVEFNILASSGSTVTITWGSFASALTTTWVGCAQISVDQNIGGAHTFYDSLISESGATGHSFSFQLGQAGLLTVKAFMDNDCNRGANLTVSEPGSPADGVLQNLNVSVVAVPDDSLISLGTKQLSAIGIYGKVKHQITYDVNGGVMSNPTYK